MEHGVLKRPEVSGGGGWAEGPGRGPGSRPRTRFPLARKGGRVGSALHLQRELASPVGLWVTLGCRRDALLCPRGRCFVAVVTGPKAMRGPTPTL